jgi:hypothetical protein
VAEQPYSSDTKFKNSAENNAYDEDNMKEAVEPAKNAVTVI